MIPAMVITIPTLSFQLMRSLKKSKPHVTFMMMLKMKQQDMMPKFK
jgi:hypothetical protein